MVSQDKLIKQGIKYTDSLFDEISKRLEAGVMSSDTLEAFLDKTKEYTTANPLVSSGYDKTMLNLILQETNNHKFSRPAQKELVRVTVEQNVGDLIVDVGEDIRDSVREIVKDGYNNNLSQDEIAANISNRVSAIKGRRARAIARTEIARTATVSDYIINKERGATHWYVECRNTACPICKHAWHEGWTEENDDTFKPSDSSAGGKGWIGDKVYPMSDTASLPPIHPNCRCVVYFVNENDLPEKGVLQDTPVKQQTQEITSNGISLDELNKMTFQEIADYYGLEYRGEKYNIVEKVREHMFIEKFEDDRRMAIYFESDAIESYTKKGIATPNEIIAEIMKVPKSLRNETNSIHFKDSYKGLGIIKNGVLVDDILDANTLGYNRTRELYKDDYTHDIIMNPRLFKGSKGRGASRWIPDEEHIIAWKKNMHHEFEHSGDQDKALHDSDEYMPNCWSEGYTQVHLNELYFTEYANSAREESWAEHGGYISYMEANPSEQHRLITVYIPDAEHGFIYKDINYAEYKEMYPEHYKWFMNRHRS